MKKVEQNTYNIKQNLKIGGKLLLSFNDIFNLLPQTCFKMSEF